MQIRERSLKQIPKKLADLPDYVTDFYNYTKVDTQPTTSLNYLLEIELFMNWLRTYTGTDYAKPLSSAKSNKDVSISTLRDLSTTDLKKYIYYLENRTTFYGGSPTIGTINHSISALKTFFRFLSVDSEVGADRRPYLSFNPMNKIKMHKDSATLNYRHQKIENQLYVGREQDLLVYIDKYYPKTLKNGSYSRALSYYKRDKERDLAIIALLLASGLRVSELASLDLNNLKLTDTKGQVTMVRKGHHQDTVGIVPWSIPYLQNYLQIRKQRYKVSDDEKALFVIMHGKRITTRTIQRMVKKYTTAYGRPSTPHKFRHTLGTDLYAETKDIVAVSEQLGQTSTSATDLYTHLGENKLHGDLSHIGENTSHGKYINSDN